MFQGAELGRKLSKEDFEAELPALRASLTQGQLQLAESQNQAMLIIIDGLDGSGRAELLNRLYAWLDPRGLSTHTFWDPTEEEKERPEFWRFWRALPKKGEIAIHLGGWYRDILTQAMSNKLSHAELSLALEKRYELERMLALDGVLILKFWLYLPEEDQRKRLTHEASTPDDRWGESGRKEAITKRKEFLLVAEQVMRQTDSPTSPWYLVESTCSRYRDITVARTMARVMKQSATLHQAWIQDSHSAFAMNGGGAPSLPDAESARVTVLDHVNLQKNISSEQYRKKLSALQEKLQALAWQAWRKKITTLIVFEGWDAAGKGGAIRRLGAGLDARLYKVVQYAAPTSDERRYPYLWRFWREIPRQGHVLMYDRSWYGRVLVERVEGFADNAAWARAYHEINDFESQLIESGIILIKFWLHISPEEQLKRFHEREQTPYKQYKITEEDWRNREKWSEYSQAVNEMVFRTGTDYSPWHLIGADNKYAARIEILQTVVDQLTNAINNQK